MTTDHLHTWTRTDLEHEDDGILRWCCDCGARGWCGRNVYLAARSPKTSVVRAYVDQSKCVKAKLTVGFENDSFAYREARLRFEHDE